MPDIDAYSAVLRLPHDARRKFLARKLARFATAQVVAPGIPGMSHWTAGQYMAIFRCRHANGTEEAVRCPRGAIPGEPLSRSQALARHLALHQPPLPYFVQHEFLEQAVYAGQEWQPAFVMEWIEGVQLDRWVADRVAEGEGGALREMADRWAEMLALLQQTWVAHGDLHHENVLVTPLGELKLVDYDSVWIPELGNGPSPVVGLRGYAHPAHLRGEVVRCQHRFLDTFAGLVVYVSLRTLAEDPTLHGRFSRENLLLRDSDLAEAEKSELFAQLRSHPDAELAALACELTRLCRALGECNVSLRSILRLARRRGSFPQLTLPAIPDPAPRWTPNPPVAVSAPPDLFGTVEVGR